MSEREWNDDYKAGQTPWDTGEPDAQLVAFVRAKRVAPGRTLEIGCGTGTNALWLADQGFDVLGIDLASVAIEQARAKAAKSGAGARCRFDTGDFLAKAPEGPFAFVFDRGCWHCFDDAAEQAAFAERVASCLAPDGLWLSLIGSTEGGPREFGPPRRSARDIALAIEPHLAIEELAGMRFTIAAPQAALTQPAAWRCVARRRSVPAQPSTRES
jgi:SAM-dependent methyltransferase